MNETYPDGMDNRDEIRAFLKTRRDKITPQQAGLPAFGDRRVKGLRRNEVAMLAGVSVEYYTRVERGNLGGVSDSVLDAISQALQLDDVERSHLYTLARAANTTPARAARRRPANSALRPGVQRIIDAMSTVPAMVLSTRFDVVAANSMGRALFSEMFEDPENHSNTARFLFLSPSARRFYIDWQRIANGVVGALHIEAGKNPFDRELSNLVGELSTRSEAFRVLWGAQDVHVFRDGTKRFNHPVIGELELDHESMDLGPNSGLTIAAYTAAPGTAAADGLKLLASWSATTADSEVSESSESDR